MLYQKQGKYGEAEPLFKRALAICEQSLGPEHPDTQSMRQGYVSLQQVMGCDEDAKKLEEDS